MKLEKFDDLVRIPERLYGGTSGPKIAVSYENSIWMLKTYQSGRFYDNSACGYDILSEYIGSSIYKLFGVPAQEVILGTYNDKLAVLCRDSAYPSRLYEFREFRNSLFSEDIIQSYTGMSTEIEDIIQVIELHPDIDTDETLKHFWTMFVFDTLIGNTDRGNDNWGLVCRNNKFVPYPVFDCGGCLRNRHSDDKIPQDLEPDTLKHSALGYTSKFTVNGKHVNPFDFLREVDCSYVNDALNLLTTEALVGVIAFLHKLIPIISETRFEWYKEILTLRFNELLDIRVSKSSLSNIERYKKKYGISDDSFELDKDRLFSLFHVSTVQELDKAIVNLL